MKRAWLQISLAGIACAASAAMAQVEGHWLGSLQISGLSLRIALEVTRAADGTFITTMDSLDQGVFGIKVAKTAFDAPSRAFKFEAPNLAATYEGILSSDGKKISGKFTQAGVDRELIFERQTSKPTLERPQTPKGPFPYKEEEVSYENKSAGIKIAGTLSLPTGDGPFPAVLLLTGSGAQDRNESIMGHKPFWVIADYLTRRGIAVLRVDDRGVGGTGGNLMESTSSELADDALAGVEFLRSRKEVDAKRIGLIGHSEGGIIGPLAATRSSNIAFVVMLAGTGVPGEEILYMQGGLIAKVMGATDEQIAEQISGQKEIFAILKSEKPLEEKRSEVVAVLRKRVEALPEEQRKSLGNVDAYVMMQTMQVANKWFVHFVSYDPRPVLKKLSVPVLVLNGELDLQVPAAQNLPEIHRCLEEGGNSDYTIIKFAGLNHLFQSTKTGSPTEYGTITETISPQVLGAIGDWIVRKFGAPPTAN